MIKIEERYVWNLVKSDLLGIKPISTKFLLDKEPSYTIGSFYTNWDIYYHKMCIDESFTPSKKEPIKNIHVTTIETGFSIKLPMKSKKFQSVKNVIEQHYFNYMCLLILVYCRDVLTNKAKCLLYKASHDDSVLIKHRLTINKALLDKSHIFTDLKVLNLDNIQQRIKDTSKRVASLSEIEDVNDLTKCIDIKFKF